METAFFQLTRTRRIRLNTGRHRCETDPDYRVPRCLEEFVAEKAGCSSPWNVYPSDVCEQISN